MEFLIAIPQFQFFSVIQTDLKYLSAAWITPETPPMIPANTNAEIQPPRLVQLFEIGTMTTIVPTAPETNALTNLNIILFTKSVILVSIYKAGL